MATAHDLRTAQAALPPGPARLPYIGNLLAMRRDPLGYLQQLQRTYGNMATIYLGRMPVVVLFRPEYVRYVLVEHPRQFSNRPLAESRDPAGTANEGLLTIDGEKHRQQRRAVQPAFHKKRVEGYAAVIEQYTQELLKAWQAGETVDLSSAMQELTLRIVSKCLFNVDLTNQLDALGGAFNNMLASSTSMAEDVLNIHIDNPITGYGKRMEAMRQLDMFIYTLITQRRDDPRDHNDVLSMLMEAQDGEEPELKLTDKQIHDHILTFLAAGHETTAINLVWTFYLLSRNPQVREKLLDEIRTVLRGRSASVDDLARMPYTDCVLSESMRLYPPAWMQMRFVAEEFELDGVKLPAGTLLMLSQWVIHRLPEIWEDAEVFRPERWEPAYEQNVPAGAYFPFGGGPRNCIGMPFAQLEARLILTTLLQRYTPQVDPAYRPGLQPAITLRPRQRLRALLLPTAANPTADHHTQLMRVPDVALGERQGCRGALLSLFSGMNSPRSND
jgi:cytochrome P450